MKKNKNSLFLFCDDRCSTDYCLNQTDGRLFCKACRKGRIKALLQGMAVGLGILVIAIIITAMASCS